MAREKSWLTRAVVASRGALAESAFDAADVGDELLLTQHRRQAVEPFEDREDGPAQKDEVGLRGGRERIVGSDGDGFAAQRGVELVGARIPSRNGAGKSVGAQGESEGGAEEAGAEDGNSRDGQAV